MDLLNFFSDLVRYNYGWVYLPGEAAQIMAYVLVQDSKNREINAPRYGPLTQFDVDKFRAEKWAKPHLRRIRELFQRSSQSSLAESILSALQWAGRATVEPKREQSFLLYAIALETLILPGQEVELGYRLRTRVARLLERDPRKRTEITVILKKLYGTRSKIVHSGSYDVSDEDLGRLRAITKTVIIRMLMDEQIRRMKTSEELEQWFESRALQ